MPNDENACIRYLMKELDPSEEMLMERAMMEDEDLLIEVECMRQTLKRLDDMPEISPPRHLTESIVDQAVRYREENNRTSLSQRLPAFSYAAAAVVLLTGLVLSGMYLSDNIFDSAQGPNNSETPAVQSSSVQSSEFNMMPVSNNQTKPWVDRDNVIHFQDRFNSKSRAAYDSIMEQSTQKLKLINEPFFYQTNSRVLQLTGSNK